jgi:hypothetical protein
MKTETMCGGGWSRFWPYAGRTPSSLSSSISVIGQWPRFDAAFFVFLGERRAAVRLAARAVGNS